MKYVYGTYLNKDDDNVDDKDECKGYAAKWSNDEMRVKMIICQ